jgi:error-prone DNA polymerase
MIATNAVLYHHLERRPLQDADLHPRGTIIDKLRHAANAERHRKPAQMARLFRGMRRAGADNGGGLACTSQKRLSYVPG